MLHYHVKTFGRRNVTPNARSSKALRVLAAAALFLACLSAYAQDTLAQISKHQERIEKLESEFFTSQRRLLSFAGTSDAQFLAHDQLNAVGQWLNVANREFGVLTQSLMLASRVTDKRAMPHAIRIVEAQKKYMADGMRRMIDITEKALARAKDQETSRLLLEARDVLKGSTEFVENLKAPLKPLK